MKYSQKYLNELLDKSESGNKILTEREINILCFDEKVDAVAALVSVAESHRQLLKQNNSLSEDIYNAKADCRLMVLPFRVWDTVWVDKRTIHSTYFHPADNVGKFAKCEIVSFVITKSASYMKLRALYPSRKNRRGYLRYSFGAIGISVFPTMEDTINK